MIHLLAGSGPLQRLDLALPPTLCSRTHHPSIILIKTILFHPFFIFLQSLLIKLTPHPTTELPWPEASHFTLAILHIELGQQNRGLEILELLLEVYPDHSMALLNVGNHYFNLGDFGRAQVSL